APSEICGVSSRETTNRSASGAAYTAHRYRIPPRGGVSLWLEAREGEVLVSELDRPASAVRHGVTFDPGRGFRVQRSDRLSLRLCYSGTIEDAIERGVRRLGEALRALGAQQTWSPRRAL